MAWNLTVGAVQSVELNVQDTQAHSNFSIKRLKRIKLYHLDQDQIQVLCDERVPTILGDRAKYDSRLTETTDNITADHSTRMSLEIVQNPNQKERYSPMMTFQFTTIYLCSTVSPNMHPTQPIFLNVD